VIAARHYRCDLWRRDNDGRLSRRGSCRSPDVSDALRDAVDGIF
jgi:hypothetical protein